MKPNTLNNSKKRVERLKNTVTVYRGRIQKLKKQLLGAAKNYKEAIEKERMEEAKKRLI